MRAGIENFPIRGTLTQRKRLGTMDVSDSHVPDRFAALADPTLPGKRLFALRRIAGALESGFLTLEEAKRAAARIAPTCAQIFNDVLDAEGTPVIITIEMILQERYPTRFRADVPR